MAYESITYREFHERLRREVEGVEHTANVPWFDEQ